MDMMQSFICMIPKKSEHEKVKNFRPISLCNVVYKILSKIITTRLVSFLE